MSENPKHNPKPPPSRLRKSIPLTRQILVETVTSALSTCTANIIVSFKLTWPINSVMGNKLDCLLIVAVDLSLNFVSIQFSGNQKTVF